MSLTRHFELKSHHAHINMQCRRTLRDSGRRHHDRQKVTQSISGVSRLTPKQECMVELDKLPLVLSTESIESISLSGSYKLTSDSHNGLIARHAEKLHQNALIFVAKWIV